MEMITITSNEGMLDDTETHGVNIGLFPESIKRAKRFEGKRVIFFTGRVHPGETPGAHVLNGALDIICE